VVGVSSATTDGADVLASAVGPVVGFTAAVTDGADVLSATVVAVVVPSYPGGSLLGFGPFSTVPLSALAPAKTAVGFSSATTDGADTLASVVDSGGGQLALGGFWGGWWGYKHKKKPEEVIEEVVQQVIAKAAGTSRLRNAGPSKLSDVLRAIEVLEVPKPQKRRIVKAAKQVYSDDEDIEILLMTLH
jgi:hypothetical protein